MPSGTDRWAQLAEKLGTDLFLDLQPDPSRSTRGRGAALRRNLTAALRAAITDGRLPAGTRLPPYRSLAADLGVARGTVAAVYAELAAEGWLRSRQGSSTIVSHSAAPPDVAQPGVAQLGVASQPIADPDRGPRHRFGLGQPTTSLFPRSDWIAATRTAMTTASHDAFGPGDPRGARELRDELARYLARVRGVRTTADHIVLTTSVHTALVTLATHVLGQTVAVEGLGMPFHRMALEEAGCSTVALPVDADGADVGALGSYAANTVLLTPSHQFPTGVALSPERRARAVAWARETGGYLIEDDYDGELRYDREPIGALQTLAPDRVIYTGSVSKTLSPAVRIAWLVLPEPLIEPIVAAKGIRERDASIVDQLILAEMLRSGAYDRHIRRSRQFYRRRRDHLAARLREAGVAVAGIDAGLHAHLPCPRADEPELLAAAYEEGFELYSLDLFRHPDYAEQRPGAAGGLIVGFGAPADSTFAADVEALATFARRLPAPVTSRTGDSGPRSHAARAESPPAGTPASRRR